MNPEYKEIKVEVSAMLHDPARGGYYLSGKTPVEPNDLYRPRGEGFCGYFFSAEGDGCAILAQVRPSNGRNAQFNFAVKWDGVLEAAYLPALKEAMAGFGAEDIGEKILRLEKSMLPEPSEYLVAGMMQALEYGAPCVLDPGEELPEEAFPAALGRLKIPEGGLTFAWPLPSGVPYMDINLLPADPAFQSPVCRETVYILSAFRWADFVSPEIRKKAKRAVGRQKEKKPFGIPLRKQADQMPDVSQEKAAEQEDRNAEGVYVCEEAEKRRCPPVIRKLILPAACAALSVLMVFFGGSFSPGMIILFEDGSELFSMVCGAIWGAFIMFCIQKQK